MSLTIKILASSSAANCYRIDDGETALLLEAGLPIQMIKKALNFKVSALAGCLVTHLHLDHFKATKDLMKAGINCYMSRGTAEATGTTGHRLKIICAGAQFRIGSWDILPFDTAHDCPEPLGFLLGSGHEKVLFATDTAYLKYQFSGLTRLMIECNYDTESLNNNQALNPAMRKRIMFNHFGLENVLDFIRVNDMSHVKEVYLLHLSNDNSNAALIKRAVQAVAGCPVYVAGA